jgi:hypothetical protein
MGQVFCIRGVMSETNASAREADWEFIAAQLPAGWRELGAEMGLVRKRPAHIGQKILDIGIVLRLVLHYVAQRGSMRATTAAAAAAGIVKISQVAFFKWMFKIGAYLEALVARMVEPGRYALKSWGGYVLIAGDATTVERPGAKGTTARIHYALHLSDLRPRFVRITDETVGETARHFDAAPNELWILDRGYSNPPSVFALVERKADILVRLNRPSMCLVDGRGDRIDVRKFLTLTRKRGRAYNKSVLVRSADGRTTPARVCWTWLPKPDADKARARAARDGVKDPVDLELAEFIVVLTTAPKRRLSAKQVLALYRARWQVELDFKRDKSLGQLDTLPSLLPQTIHAWLCAKVLLGLVARRLASQSVAIPPCGLGDAILPKGKTIHRTRARRRTLVRHPTGLATHAFRASAHHAS